MSAPVFNDPISNRHGERLDYTFCPGKSDPHNLVVIGHGVTAHKDRPWLIALSEALSEAGIASLRFSFSGNGESQGQFRESTVTKEVEDLQSVLDTLEGWTLIYAGHSMGGAVGVLSAGADKRISALISLAGMVHIGDFMRNHFGRLRPGQDGMFDKPDCPLTQEFLDDAFALDSVLQHAKKISVPWLIVHGDADEIVPLQDSLDIQKAAGGRIELVELMGDHRFTEVEDAMTEAVVPWVEQRFATGFPSPEGM